MIFFTIDRNTLEMAQSRNEVFHATCIELICGLFSNSADDYLYLAYIIVLIGK
jgi:hypothetical protein